MSGEPIKLDLQKVRDAGKEATPKADLVPDLVDVRVKWKNPKTGALHLLEAQSKVPISRTELGRSVAHQCAGLPFSSYAPVDQARMAAIARISLQLQLPDKGAEWLSAALDTDDTLLFELEVALADHERRWFLGVNPAGGQGSSASRVAIPAFATAGPAGMPG